MSRLPRNERKEGAHPGGQTPEGDITLDFRGKIPGRGAYVCPNAECLEKAVKTRAIDRALETKVPPELYDALREQLEAEK
jgi:predicted RNA-binding protein YlxR (DUF448 family)